MTSLKFQYSNLQIINSICETVTDRDFSYLLSNNNNTERECVMTTVKQVVRRFGTLHVKRVMYGSRKVNVKDREYRINGSGPVGNKSDWLDYAKKVGYMNVCFTDDIEQNYEAVSVS